MPNHILPPPTKTATPVFVLLTRGCLIRGGQYRGPWAFRVSDRKTKKPLRRPEQCHSKEDLKRRMKHVYNDIKELESNENVRPTVNN